jgi:fumarate reductase subunit C
MMATRKPYVRSMDGWWRRNPFYVRYMLREASSVFIAVYALLLLWGLWALHDGANAYDAWLAAMRNPAIVLFHVAAAVFVSYHAYTWWKVAPKTMPSLRFGGKEVPESWITAAGWAAWAVATVATLVFAAGGTT